MRDLSKLGPFRIRDKKAAFNSKVNFLKIAFKQNEYKMFFSYILFFNNMYVASYKDTYQANEAWISHKMHKKIYTIMDRHKRMWNKFIEPCIVLVTDK